MSTIRARVSGSDLIFSFLWMFDFDHNPFDRSNIVCFNVYLEKVWRLGFSEKLYPSSISWWIKMIDKIYVSKIRWNNAVPDILSSCLCQKMKYCFIFFVFFFTTLQTSLSLPRFEVYWESQFSYSLNDDENHNPWYIGRFHIHLLVLSFVYQFSIKDWLETNVPL